MAAEVAGPRRTPRHVTMHASSTDHAYGAACSTCAFTLPKPSVLSSFVLHIPRPASFSQSTVPSSSPSSVRLLVRVLAQLLFHASCPWYRHSPATESSDYVQSVIQGVPEDRVHPRIPNIRRRTDRACSCTSVSCTTSSLKHSDILARAQTRSGRLSSPLFLHSAHVVLLDLLHSPRIPASPIFLLLLDVYSDPPAPSFFVSLIDPAQ